jgi:hypothetical protein
VQGVPLVGDFYAIEHKETVSTSGWTRKRNKMIDDSVRHSIWHLCKTDMFRQYREGKGKGTHIVNCRHDGARKGTSGS